MTHLTWKTPRQEDCYIVGVSVSVCGQGGIYTHGHAPDVDIVVTLTNTMYFSISSLINKLKASIL